MLCCYNRMPKSIKDTNLFLTILEAEKVKLVGSISGKGLDPASFPRRRGIIKRNAEHGEKGKGPNSPFYQEIHSLTSIIALI